MSAYEGSVQQMEREAADKAAARLPKNEKVGGKRLVDEIKEIQEASGQVRREQVLQRATPLLKNAAKNGQKSARIDQMDDFTVRVLESEGFTVRKVADTDPRCTIAPYLEVSW